MPVQSFYGLPVKYAATGDALMTGNQSLILVPFAFDENKCTGVNVCKSGAYETYCKNLCVSLISAKKYNADSDVALVTNVSLPQKYRQLLTANGIILYQEAFDSFVFPDDYLWSLAFYKLCALEKMVAKYEYQYYAYLDADVIVQDSFEHIWRECDDNILLYDINHGLGTADYAIITGEFSAFTGQKELITHYGGEFFAANRENAGRYIACCKRIYDEMISRNFKTSKGDEFIVSLAAHELKQNVRNAGAYFFRFWSGAFYLVSTCYRFNAVTVLHLPTEKNHGMIKIFDRYLSKSKFPSKERIYRCCHLRRPAFKTTVSVLKNRIFSHGKKDA